jgi:pilus assembly protein CpaC
MCKPFPLRLIGPLLILSLLPTVALAQQAGTPLIKPSIVYKVQAPSEQLEMTVHTSRLFTMDQKIVQAQVNNQDVLELTPLGPNQIQVAAKASGVTQINLWGEDQKLFTVDVLVNPDVRQLEMVLRMSFPRAALKVTPVANTVMIAGFVDQADQIDRIIRVAEEYYPKVINNMIVGGVQTVLLHVKVMEVSRSKLRQLGFDWAKITGGNMVASGVSGMVLPPSSPTLPAGLPGTGTPPAPSTASNNPVAGTFAFNVANVGGAFFGVLDALREDGLMKIVSEPTVIAESGRVASFNVGGSVPVPQPQGLGSVGITYQAYGTKIEFVPIVLGNGKIHLEVRPSISELDYATGIQLVGSSSVTPGLTTRDVSTAMEMMAGETMAIAGLLERRTESENVGLPWISEVPYIGAAFRRVKETVNEVELLILVTPELVCAMSASEAPACGPGLQTKSPSDWELFMKGHLEVPNCCPSDGSGKCPQKGDAPSGPPSDGMILGPSEIVPAPQPAGASGRSGRASDADASNARPTSSDGVGSESRNRYSPSKPNSSVAAAPLGSPDGPPGFIGPIGYDVVK